ncbi:peroxiredoxin [Nonlabens dokdonensis]|jgi:peroxiredoxin|uniref:Bromoperoxidase n=2 Tax=Nonlabens dokdonensis TaxID=328515 RepID=L7WGH7_NONDD|nr:alpha/beta hydrolase [Nonlabens dokdonensis]AGC78038.1 bromoperoxidase [Nonlabens dokdonensis DSW-6]PZX37104.1 peroxiredoxin [Nonlabens dokdonensis]
MPYLEKTTAQKDADVNIYYEDHGSGKPIILIHGWPLSGAMWEYQVQTLIKAGHRVITYDRRGFGKSSRPYNGYNYDNMAEDLHDLIKKLDLVDVILAGFSMGGGEVAQYVDTFGTSRISKLIFISSIAPFLLKTEDNPDGAPDDVFKGMEENVKNDRLGFLKGFGEGFVNYEDNKDRISQGQLDYNFQIAAAASPKGTLDCINAFGRTDLRDALKKIDVPTLFIHGDADNIVPIEPSSKQGHKLVKDSKLEIIKDAPHGLYVTHTDELNEILLDFLK